MKRSRCVSCPKPSAKLGVEDTVGWMAVRIIVRDANGSIVFKFED